MLNLRRSPLLVVTLALLAALVSVGRAQDTEADQAQAALRQGMAQFHALEFRMAKQTLLGIDRAALPDADKNTLDEYIERVDPAIEQQASALAAYRDAETALRNGELAKAKEGFAAAAASEYLPAAARQDATAQLAVVDAKMQNLAEVAAALEETPQTPSTEAQPVATPVEEVMDEPAPVEPEPIAVVAPAEPAPVTPAEAAPVAAQPVGTTPAPDMSMTQPADRQMETPVQTAMPVAAPVQSDTAMPMAVEDRGGRVDELVAQGQQALAANDPNGAIGYFQRALALDPDNAVARQQLDYARRMTASASAADGDILSRLETSRSIKRQSADVEYDQAMMRSYEVLARADSGAEFDAAADDARVARNVLETNRALFSDAEYRERMQKVTDQLALVETRRDEWSQQRVAMQVEEIQQREATRRSQEAERRERKISDLQDRARVLRSEGKYELALEVVQQILNIDPNDPWAAEQVGVLRQFVMLQEEGQLHQIQRDQEQKQLLDVRRSEIPWYELVKYPEDWKELSRRREPFGAEVGGTGSAEDRELRMRLAERIPADLQFDGTPFRDVIEFLQTTTQANIFPKWTALGVLGIDEQTPVTLQLSNVSFKKALETVLEYVGGIEPLGYMIDGGVITISTRDDLATKTYTDVYDIRDLIVRVPNFVAPEMDLASAGETQTGNGGGGIDLFGDAGDQEDDEGNIPTRAEIIFNIITLIQETIDPLSWQPIGEVGSIRELHGQLVVTQTAENHEALMNLIRKLREARALQVSIEARFISVNTGFLNSIGLDLDFFFNLGSRLGSTSVVDPFTGATVPTSGGTSGWGNGPPGNQKFTPMGVNQGSFGNTGQFTNMLGVSSPVGGTSIGSVIDESALSLGGTFLDDIQVNFLIQATQAHSSTRSLIAPRLTLFNGQRAYVMVATTQAYVADLEPLVADNAVVNNPIPGTVASGAVLDVEATISADRRYVTLTVRPTVSNVLGFRTFAVDQTEQDDEGNPISGTGFFELPTMSIQQLMTTVSVPDGGTLLLGGQKLSGEVEREMGVPLLNKIPVINRAFSNRGMVRDEQTLLILIKPKIIIQREEELRQHPD